MIDMIKFWGAKRSSRCRKWGAKPQRIPTDSQRGSAPPLPGPRPVVYDFCKHYFAHWYHGHRIQFILQIKAFVTKLCMRDDDHVSQPRRPGNTRTHVLSSLNCPMPVDGFTGQRWEPNEFKLSPNNHSRHSLHRAHEPLQLNNINE